MGVQHIQMVGAQTAQAVLHVLNDAPGRQVAVDRGAVHHLMKDGGVVAPLQTALGGKHHFVAVDVLQRFAHHFLAVVQAVDGRGVDPLDALFHGSLDGLDRQAVVVVAPPCTAADGPGAHAEERHRDAALADFNVLHILTLHASSVPRNGKQSYKHWHSLLYASYFMKKELQLRDFCPYRSSLSTD